MQIAPGLSARASSLAVCSFMHTRTWGSRTWQIYPFALARMWNQVGKPSILEGNTFLPLQGIPIAYKARKITRLADWLPEPLTVPTRIARSLTVGAIVARPARTGASSTTERLDDMISLALRAAQPRCPR